MSETERSGKSKRAERWTPAQAREVIERWRASGQSAAAFAAQHGISATRLSYWSKQLGLEENESPQFVPVVVPAEPSVAHAVEIEVGGLTVRVRENADMRFVVRLVSALQHRSVPPC